MPLTELSHRRIRGISAVLLPFLPTGEIDWESFEVLLERTWGCGLVPAINMDTGFANLIAQSTRHEILAMVKEQASQREFVGGVFVEDLDGEVEHRYLMESERVERAGGIPILFPSTGLSELTLSQRLEFFETIGARRREFYAFELGKMFVPFGEIYDLEFFTDLIQIPSLTGLKHSSLSREQEWQRLSVCKRIRPEFRIYTGNDLAIDMVKWGSDYLLGLSAFYPEAFAKRDRYWENGDQRFYELNDWLQYLGFLAFRNPVPAYKHSCASFLKMRGLIKSSWQPSGALLRPESDLALLECVLAKLDELTA